MKDIRNWKAKGYNKCTTGENKGKKVPVPLPQGWIQEIKRM
jgi:hypothetical protein